MLLFDNPKFSDNGNSDIIYVVNELLNQPIVLVNLSMINVTPNIFYFHFIFSVYFIF